MPGEDAPYHVCRLMVRLRRTTPGSTHPTRIALPHARRVPRVHSSRSPYSVCMSPFASEVTAARAAQELWGRFAVRERLRPVRRLRSLLVERADDLFAAVHADIG